jgi:WD40 repeat protein
VWRLPGGERVADLPHEAPVLTVAFSPDGSHILSAANRVRLWDWAAAREEPVPFPANDIALAAFDPSGQRVVSAGEEIRVFDARTGRLESLLEYGSEALTVAWSGDGRLLLASSVDSTTRVWDAGTGDELVRFVEGVRVNDTALSAAGDRVATAAARWITVRSLPIRRPSAQELDDLVRCRVPFALEGTVIVRRPIDTTQCRHRGAE